MVRRLLVAALLALLLAACSDKAPPTWDGDAALAVSDVGHDSATLAWPSAKDDVGVVHYRVLRDGAEITQVDGTAHTHTVRGLEELTEHGFAVVALDAAGNESERLRAVVTTTDGSAPTWPAGARFTATEPLPDEPAEGAEEEPLPEEVHVVFAWGAAEDNVGVTEYRVLRGEEVLATVAAPATRHEADLAPGGSYSVVAVDAAGHASGPLRATEPDLQLSLEGVAPVAAQPSAILEPRPFTRRLGDLRLGPNTNLLLDSRRLGTVRLQLPDLAAEGAPAPE